jgi:hypothetical protein
VLSQFVPVSVKGQFGHHGKGTQWLERALLNLVKIIEELLEGKNSGFGLQN